MAVGALVRIRLACLFARFTERFVTRFSVLFLNELSHRTGRHSLSVAVRASLFARRKDKTVAAYNYCWIFLHWNITSVTLLNFRGVCGVWYLLIQLEDARALKKIRSREDHSRSAMRALLRCPLLLLSLLVYNIVSYITVSVVTYTPGRPRLKCVGYSYATTNGKLSSAFSSFEFFLTPLRIYTGHRSTQAIRNHPSVSAFGFPTSTKMCMYRYVPSVAVESGPIELS